MLSLEARSAIAAIAVEGQSLSLTARRRDTACAEIAGSCAERKEGASVGPGGAGGGCYCASYQRNEKPLAVAGTDAASLFCILRGTG
jgi:hypothetical protein